MPSAGQQSLAEGHDVGTDGLSSEARRLIGLVPQELSAPMRSRRSWRRSRFSRGLFGKSGHDAAYDRAASCATCHCGSKRDSRRSCTLSGGMKRRVHDCQGAVARAATSCFSMSRPRALTSSCAATCGSDSAQAARGRRDDCSDNALHRRSRGDGGPGGRDQQGQACILVERQGRADAPKLGKSRASDLHAGPEADDDAAGRAGSPGTWSCPPTAASWRQLRYDVRRAMPNARACPSLLQRSWM